MVNFFCQKLSGLVQSKFPPFSEKRVNPNYLKLTKLPILLKRESKIKLLECRLMKDKLDSECFMASRLPSRFN